MLDTKLTRSQRLLIIISISLSFFLAEIAVGFYTRALVLVADAFHYLTDLVGYIVAFAAFKISDRDDAPKVLSFGWQRATLLGAFFNGVFLLGLGLSIFLQSIERFVSIEPVQNPGLVLIIGCVGLTLNMLSAAILSEHSHDHGAKSPSVDLRGRVPPTIQHENHRHEQQLSARAEGKSGSKDLGVMGVLLHVLGDAVNNVGVIIAAAIIWKTTDSARFYADPAVSMGIAVMIMVSSLPLMKRSGLILMQSSPGDVDPEDVRHDLETLPGVLAIHDLHVWALNQDKTVASVHVVVSRESVQSLDDFSRLANLVDECLHGYGIHSVTLQPEVVSIENSGGNRMLHADTDSTDRVDKDVTADTVCRVGCRTINCGEPKCCD